MTDQTKTTSLCRVAPVVKELELLRVTTIKKKFVEQMPSLDFTELLNDAEVVGVANHFVVVRLADGRVAKARTITWLGFLTAPAEGVGVEAYRAAQFDANQAVRDYPQLFED